MDMRQRQLVVAVANAVAVAVAAPRAEDVARLSEVVLAKKKQPKLNRKKWRSVAEYRAACAICCWTVPPSVLAYLNTASRPPAHSKCLVELAGLRMNILELADPSGSVRARYRRQCIEEYQRAQDLDQTRSLRKRVAAAIRARRRPGKPKWMLKEKEISSFGTARSMQSAVTQFALWLQEQDLPWSTEVPIILILAFLDDYRRRVKQSTLNTMRRYLNWFYAIALPPVKSFIDGPSKHRALTNEEVHKVLHAAEGTMLLLVRLLLGGGFRPCELLSIARPCEQPAPHRGLLPERFFGQECYPRYTVDGKGGRIHEVPVEADLSLELEQRRRPQSVKLKDHGSYAISFYDIPAGAKLTRVIGNFSQRVLGWRATPTSYRYTFAQRLLRRFAAAGFKERVALKAVAQRMGHLSPEKSLPYVKPILPELYPTTRRANRERLVLIEHAGVLLH